MTEPTACDQCGQPLGAPHRPLGDDCVLPHPDHQQRRHGLLCGRHYGRILDTLREIEELWALTASAYLPGAGGDGVKVHTSSVHSPAPGNVAVMDLRDRRPRAHHLDPDDQTAPDVIGVLGGWVRMVVDAGQWRPPAAPHGPICAALVCGHGSCRQIRGVHLTLSQMLAVLKGARMWLAAQDDVVYYAEELEGLQRALAGATRAGMWPQPIGTCPNCQKRIYTQRRADVVECRRCKTAWKGVHLVRLRLIFEQENSA